MPTAHPPRKFRSDWNQRQYDAYQKRNNEAKSRNGRSPDFATLLQQQNQKILGGVIDINRLRQQQEENLRRARNSYNILGLLASSFGLVANNTSYGMSYNDNEFYNNQQTQEGRYPDHWGPDKNTKGKIGRVLFFKNEKEAYKYMLNNTVNDIEEGGESTRPIENFAYVTKAGVYVLPTAGVDIDGNNYRNYANNAEWRVLDYRIDENGMLIKYNGKWVNVLASVHTHPIIPMGVPSHSSADIAWVNNNKTFGVVLSLNGQTYGMIPGSSESINFASNADLLSGRVSLIRHYNLLMQYFKSNK